MGWIGGGLLLGLAAVLPAADTFELSGELQPRAFIVITIYGVTTPFIGHTFAELDGHFKFKKLKPGTYQLTLNSRRRGEARQTVEIGPSFANAKGKVKITLPLATLNWVRPAEGRLLVNIRELSVPEKAKREFFEAQRRVGKHDIAGANTHLRRAVEIAPNYVAAWNYLGTLAYQSRELAEAENYFREALRHNPDAFEPTVNLGGVLITMQQVQDAIPYNEKAVAMRPEDALANAQLGMSYFYTRRFDAAEKYLRKAKALDPLHFSHPQLMLSEIQLRRGNRAGAAAELEDFVRRHPDYPEVAQMRARIARLKNQP
jgi:tetratricopeptide (TPR) repeat protein